MVDMSCCNCDMSFLYSSDEIEFQNKACQLYIFDMGCQIEPWLRAVP